MAQRCLWPLTSGLLLRPLSPNPVNVSRESCWENPRDAALSHVAQEIAMSEKSSVLVPKVGSSAERSLDWLKNHTFTYSMLFHDLILY